MISAMPPTAFFNTSSAAREAFVDAGVVPMTSISLSLRMTMSESTCLENPGDAGLG